MGLISTDHQCTPTCKYSFVKVLNSDKNTITNLRPTGVLCIRWSVGGSVANASAPRVSMIKFTQRSYTKNRKPCINSIFNFHYLRVIPYFSIHDNVIID